MSAQTLLTEQLADRHPPLAELPDLAATIGRLMEADRLIARAVDDLARLDEAMIVETTTGIGLTDWLTLVAGRTGTDARMLLTAARTCRRLPSLRAGFLVGSFAWAQVRAVVLRAHRMPRHLDDAVDHAIARVAESVHDGEPDSLVHAVSRALASIEESAGPREQASAPPEEFLAMQPRLDGTGGQLFADVGPLSWATIDAALNLPESTDHDPGAESTPPAGGDPSAGSTPTATTGGRAAKRRLARLVGILDDWMAGGTSTGGASAGRASASRASAGSADDAPASPTSADVKTRSVHSSPDRGSRPQLLLRADLANLLDRDRTPATLLTTLLGGRAWLDARTTRRLLDERGADLRAVVIDDTGSVVGVGRKARLAPGWLRDATLALHDRCSAPNCARAARTAHVDHARPWHPARAGDRPGSTDIDQLAPLCDHHNTYKERDGWRVDQAPDGSRTWWHERSGVSTRTLPATWQPPATHPRPAVAREEHAAYLTSPPHPPHAAATSRGVHHALARDAPRGGSARFSHRSRRTATGHRR